MQKLYEQGPLNSREGGRRIESCGRGSETRPDAAGESKGLAESIFPCLLAGPDRGVPAVLRAI